MCAPAGPHVTTSQPFGYFSLATRLQRGEDSGAREAKRTGVSGDANTLQHNTITIGSPSHRGCCVCLCANGRESSAVGVRLVNRRWPAVFLATRTGRRHSEPHSGCASSLRYTGTCSATAVQPAHQCLNVPPFVVAGHGELSWPRGQALGPGNSRFYLSNNPATADLRLGGGLWESWRTLGATHDIPGYSCGYFEEHGALALAPGP